MSDLTDLYQEVILDHNRRPRNFRALDGASHHAEGYNPLCGDRLQLYLQVDGDVITDVGVPGIGLRDLEGVGVADDRRVKGRPVAEARALFERFHRMVTTPPDQPVEDIGKLSVLAGVREFPVRVKCASLAWHTLKAALDRKDQTSTE